MKARRPNRWAHGPRALLVLLVAALAALGLAACGEPDTEEPEEPVATETPEEGPQPVGEPGTEEVATEDFPDAAGTVAQLTNVRVASHEQGGDEPSFDRVVLDFDGDDPPTWRVTYVEDPIREDATGHVIPVEGEAFLEVRLEPAAGVNIEGEQPERTYLGPGRIRVNGHAITEVVRVGDFEGNLAWVIGLERRVPFAAELLEDPLRMVVDVFDDPEDEV